MMLLGLTTVLALQAAASFALGKPTPAHQARADAVEGDALDIDQLQALAQTAFDNAQAELNGTAIEKRVGRGCSPSDLKIRREWYVASAISPSPSPAPAPSSSSSTPHRALRLYQRVIDDLVV